MLHSAPWCFENYHKQRVTTWLIVTNWLVVSTHLKICSSNWINFPFVGVTIIFLKPPPSCPIYLAMSAPKHLIIWGPRTSCHKRGRNHTGPDMPHLVVSYLFTKTMVEKWPKQTFRQINVNSRVRFQGYHHFPYDLQILRRFHKECIRCLPWDASKQGDVNQHSLTEFHCFLAVLFAGGGGWLGTG